MAPKACVDLQEWANRLAPLFDITHPPVTQFVFESCLKISELCRDPGLQTCSAAAHVFCRQAFQVATLQRIPHCPLDTLGWSLKGYFDFLEEQPADGTCSKWITPLAESSINCPSQGKGIPLDAVLACSKTETIEIPLRDFFLVSSVWISGPRGRSRMSYTLGLQGKSRPWWHRSGRALNLSSQAGWHTLPFPTASLLRVKAVGFVRERTHCVCVAIRGCGWLRSHPSPPLVKLFEEPFPIFGMQFLIQDMQEGYTTSDTRPCEEAALFFVDTVMEQLRAPGARLLPFDKLLPETPEMPCSPVAAAKLHSAKALILAPQPLNATGAQLPPRANAGRLQARLALREVDEAEQLLRKMEDAFCKWQPEVWLLLHRTHLRVVHRADPMLNNNPHPADVRDLLPEVPSQHPCAGVAFTSQFGQDRWALEEIFCCKRHGVYVDIGAAHSWKLSNTYAMDVFLDWRGICIDAMFENRAGFERTRSCELREQPVWRVSGEARTFLLPSNQPAHAFGHGWLIGDNQSAERQKTLSFHEELGQSWTLNRNTVVTISLWDALVPFLQLHKLDAVDFLTLDIEGHEDTILEAFFDEAELQNSTLLIRAMSIEVMSAEKSRSIQRILQRHGYVRDGRCTTDEFWLHCSVVPCRKRGQNRSNAIF